MSKIVPWHGKRDKSAMFMLYYADEEMEVVPAETLLPHSDGFFI